jgi:hypothetical protein
MTFRTGKPSNHGYGRPELLLVVTTDASDSDNTRSPALRDLTRKVLLTCLHARATISAFQWLSTREHILADYRSRKP